MLKKFLEGYVILRKLFIDVLKLEDDLNIMDDAYCIDGVFLRWQW